MLRKGKSMGRHAVLITAHSQPKTLILLLKALDDIDIDIYLHWNNELTEDLKAELLASLSFSKLVFMPRHKLYWGSPEMIDVHYDFYKMTSNKGYQFVHLITGQCYPIHSNKVMKKFFDENQETIFIQVAQVKKLKWYLYSRFAYKQVFNKARNSKLLKKTFFTLLILINDLRQKLLGVDFVKSRIKGELKFGFAWYSLPNNVLEYIIKKEEWIKYCFKDSFGPEEAYMQTLLWNSDYRTRIAVNPRNGRFFSLRYVSFEGRKFGSGHPKNIQIQDLDEMFKSGCFFARKVDAEHDLDVIEKIKQFREREDVGKE